MSASRWAVVGLLVLGALAWLLLLRGGHGASICPRGRIC